MKTKFNGILTLLLALVVQISFAQEKTVSGTVADKEGGLPGVSVLIKGTTKGTDTDFDGKYTIKANVGDVLVFSYLGYQTVERTVGSAAVINVTLKEGGEVLDEIVVTSYGRALNSKKSAASLARVDGKTIENVPINSVDQVLQGAAAGVNVSTGSGQPGQSGTIIIRGLSSLSGDIEPLFIMDGLPIDQDNFRSINQNDIESVTVLKDASATALYGNRGAGGVVVITTKRGKLGQKLDIQYRAQYGVSANPKTRFSVMNTEQCLGWQNQYGIGYGGGLTQAQIAGISAQANTNWEDIFFRFGSSTMHELSLSSGTQNSTSYTSINYFSQEGIVRSSSLERFSFRTNNSGRSQNGKFNYSTQVSLNYSKNNFVVDAARNTTGGDLDNPFIVPYIGLPYYSPWNPDGSLNNIGTRLSGALFADGSINADGANGFLNTPYLALNTMDTQTDLESELRAIIGMNFDYKVTDDITVGGQFGLDYVNIQGLFIRPPESLRGRLQPSAASEQKGFQSENTFRDAQFVTNAFLRYDKELFDKFTVSASLYGEYIYRNTQNEGFTAFGLNPALPTSGSGFTNGNTIEYPEDSNDNGVDDPEDAVYNYIPTVGSSESELALGSVLATLDLDYDGKYGFVASVRRDETSRFPNNPVGYFWSVAGRWNMDEEDFLSDVDWLSTLKVRASYGTTGNQNVGNRYQGSQQVNIDGTSYQGGVGYFTGQISSQDISWETKEALNLGFSFGLWQDRLSGEIDFYNEKTVDLFGTDDRSVAFTGFSTVTTNIGSLRNRGIDYQISYVLLNKTATNPWSIKLNVNGNINDNEILEVSGTQGFNSVFGSAVLRNQVGRPARSHYRVRWAGVDPSNGQPLYLDANGDVTNVWDPNNRVYVDKSAIPTYTGGFGGDISYKGFNLNFLFSYVADVWRNNGSLGVIEDVSLAGFANLSTSMLNAWTTPGQITDIPAVAFGGIRFQSGDRYLEDASFLRLRNINFSYTVDNDVLAKTKFLSGARIYVQASNLFTWTKWRGFDPESNRTTGNFFDYPVPRAFTFGIDLNL